MDWRRRFGNRAEDLAANYLKEKGYKILAKQFRTPFGEIDLIAKQGDEIVFVEVKARQTSEYGYPEEAVTKLKLAKIFHTGEVYLRRHSSDVQSRIDVIAIEYAGDAPKITHFEAVS